MKIEGSADISGLLRPGVFVLSYRGEVVFVGKSHTTMLPKIAALRSTDRPKFLAKITFDQIEIFAIHPDLIQSKYFDLIAEHQPKHNINLLPAVAPTGIQRRV